MIVTLGKVIEASKSNDLLGITNRAKIIDYIDRACEIALYKANWNSRLGTIDICCDEDGLVTLPSFVEVPLAVNVGGWPARFHNDWFQYHINGPGNGQACGPVTTYSWTDEGFVATFQPLSGYKWLAAIVEDTFDGDGTKSLIVEGTTMLAGPAGPNEKPAWTIPADGSPSSPGVRVPLLNGYAATDPGFTPFKAISQVTKPITRGFVKLIGVGPGQLQNGVTIGYYAPNETNPRYRRIRVNSKCKWVRVKYRRTVAPLENDYDVLPLSSYQAILDLIKAIRLRETNSIDLAESYETKATQLLTDVQNIEDGPDFAPLQVDPSFGIGTLDLR